MNVAENCRKARRERLKAFIIFQHSRIKCSRRYAVRQQQILQAADAAPSSSSSSLASVGSVTSELSSDLESDFIKPQPRLQKEGIFEISHSDISFRILYYKLNV